MKAIW